MYTSTAFLCRRSCGIHYVRCHQMKRVLVALALLFSTSTFAGVSLYVGGTSYEIGTPSFFYCFVSTVSANLEPKGLGSRFPVLINKLSKGSVPVSELSELRRELKTIQTELALLPPSKVVWELERPEKQPPWGSDISKTITNLGNYFVTSDGKDLFNVLFKSISSAERNKSWLLLQ
jgi:hypothetical protein